MMGRTSWRRTTAFAAGLALTAGIFLTIGATRPQAGLSLMDRVRASVRGGIRAIGANQPAQGVVIRRESARLLAEREDRLRRDPHLIRMRSHDFDPRRDSPAPTEGPQELLAPATPVIPAQWVGTPREDERYLVVQFEGRAGEFLAAFEKTGAEIVEFIPNSAYTVRAVGEQVDRVLDLPMVTWHGDYLPAYKVTQDVRQLLDAAADSARLPLDPRGLVRLEVVFFRGSSAGAHAEELKRLLGAEVPVIWDDDQGNAVAKVHVRPENLRQAVVELAMLRDVASIVGDEMPRPNNDHSVWFSQTGIDQPGAASPGYDVSAKLFKNGVTGRGMLGAVADDGLENDLCFYRYGNDVNEAAWPIGPGSLSADPVAAESGTLPVFPNPAPIRTRLRKVVAYYVQDSAQAYSSDVQHGTSVASCMLGDNNQVLAARPLIRYLGDEQFLPPQQPGATWTVGQQLRDDLISRVDPSSTVDDFPAITNPYAVGIEHHQYLDGMAPGAQLVMQDIGALDGSLSGSFTGLSLVRQAQNTGATVHNTSFGGTVCTSCYGGNAQWGDIASWERRDILLFSSAGNDGATGAGTIGSGFAHGKNVVTAGATERGNASSTGTPRPGENIASFSGKGPKSGGLLAPDLALPGIVAAATDSAVDPEDGSGSGTPGCGPPTVGQITGTSFSSPTLAGAGLLVQQYFMDGYYPGGVATTANMLRPTNALVRAVMTNSARNLKGSRTNDDGSGPADRPSFGQGWGAPRLDDTLYFSGDPTNDDPRGDSERARMLVLTDTPNGFVTGENSAQRPTGCFVGRTLTAESPEPGGQTRSDITHAQKPALADGGVHEFVLNVINPNPGAAANEFRVTMAYMDTEGVAGAPVVTVNDLDLEVISPSGRIYRTNPLSAWSGGFTQPSPDNREQTVPPTIDFPDRDALNPVENVFIESAEVEPGPYRIRVIGYGVPGNGRGGDVYPNYVDGDRPCSYDLNGDGTNDVDATDRGASNLQGYALVVSGNFTTTQGLVSLNRSAFDCSGGSLVVTVNDENGDSDRASCDPDGDGTGLTPNVTVEIRTSTPSVAFPSDFEKVSMNGSQPTYTSDPLPVIVTDNPLDVIHGDGVIQIANDQTFTVKYTDGNPCGGESSAQATVGCTPSVVDGGFQIEDGCDYAVPGDASSGERPDGYMDAGELIRYTVFVTNNGSDDLHDVRVSLTPDPANPESTNITVLNSPLAIGLMPPGRRSDATFLVQMGSPITARAQVDFNICVTSPADGLLYPTCFVQTQLLESDLETFRYNTRDPNGELFGPGRIARSVPGAPDPPVAPGDFVRHAPMWFDPDADCGGTPCSQVCDVGRELWPAGGASPPAGPCANPAIRTGNPWNPWDFDDSDEGWVTAYYEGDTNQLVDFYWKNGPTGGGCGWENELNNQLVALPASHPDKHANPWGIWHTGPINNTTSGPFAGQTGNNQGAPYYEPPPPGDDSDPNWHTIHWDSTTQGGGNNSDGRWCRSYVSDPVRYANYYRYFLVPPTLNRVHRSNPDFKVEFEELRFYSRMDGHTTNGDNTAVAGWYVSNQPVSPIQAAPMTYSWAQFQYGTLIFTDEVSNDWSDDDSFLDVNLRSTNSDFPGLTYENIYGPSADSWNFIFTWGHFNFTGGRSRNQYGWGVDDVEFTWTESREVADGSDCGALPGGQSPTVYFDSTRYNACQGTAHIRLVDNAQTATQVAVCVRSAAEDTEVALLTRTAPGTFEGSMPFSVDSADNVVGTLLVSAGTIDIGNAADQIVVEYDPGRSTDWDPTDPGWSPEQACDFADSEPNGINDDFVDNRTGLPPGDGIADAEDDLDGVDEVVDVSGVNCTSGRIFYVKQRLQQEGGAGSGDSDRFADHGETHFMAISLASQLGFDLEDVTVRISTLDTTVCVLNDTVHLDLMPGGGTITETPLDPLNPDPLRQGFRFSVPRDVRTTDLANPQTVTFRIDVEGRNTQNLNEFSTAGDGYNSYLPQEAKLLLDVDEVAVAATFADPAPGRPAGTFMETFEGPAAALGLDHPVIPGRPAVRVRALDATTDTRFDVNLNGGFCPECDVANDCAVPTACDYFFKPDTGGGDGYPFPPEWTSTSDWAKNGLGAYKFGRENASSTELDQKYKQGQYTTLELPPLRLANGAATPELRFWQVANFWEPNFTSGLITPVGAGIVEISAKPIGVSNWSQDPAISTTHPISSFRRLYPSTESYDNETDALNACGTLFCRYKHPCFNTKGSFITAGTGDQAGTVGPATWVETVVDLSDYRGMEVVIRFTVAVIQDLTIQPGNFGWMLDDVAVSGVGPAPVAGQTQTAIRLQAGDPSSANPCALVAGFESTSADCSGEFVQFFDRHDGLGAFSGGAPVPLRFTYAVAGGPTVGPGDPGTLISPAAAGVDPTSTYDNPRLNFAQAGLAPGRYQVTQTITQGASSVSATREVVYKDAPVPAITLASAAFSGGVTRFTSTVAVNPAIDPTRSYVYEWNFGDSTPVDTTGSAVSHVFANPGSYDVTLTVVDEDGCRGSQTLRVTVVASPAFGSPATTFVSECSDASTAASIRTDGNADVSEFVTINVTFTNTGAAASGVVGYLSSADAAVEVVRGVASFGNVANGGTPAAQPFTFIRRPVPGETLGCLAIPFTLTLTSDGGTVVQPLNFSYTMGQATDAASGPGNPAPSSFCAGDNPGATFTFNSVAGCLNGLELVMTVTGTGQATMDRIGIQIVSPDAIVHDVLYPNVADSTRSFTMDFAFGADDGDAPIRNTAGRVDDRANTLEADIEDSLIANLTGTAMAGTWQVIVYDSAAGDCSSTFNADISVFSLEGTNSADLETANESACSACIQGSAPIFAGSRSQCVGAAGSEGLVLWQPADDTSTCNGQTSLTYQIYASTTPGQRGNAPTVLTGGQTCAADCPTGTCVYARDPDATSWQVCDVENVYWTVVATDATAPGGSTPNLPAATSPVPAGYQTQSLTCAAPPPGGILRLRKMSSGTAGDVEMRVDDLLATNFRVYRGTFPVSGTFERMLRTRGAVPYDHAVLTPPGCGGFVANTAGELAAAEGNYVDGSRSYYYLAPSLNGAGCGGLGYQMNPAASPGQPLQQGPARPIVDASCGTCNP